jgi:hypothetical protein
MAFSKRQSTATYSAEPAVGFQANARRVPDAAVTSAEQQPTATDVADQKTVPQRVTFENIYGGPAATGADK